MAVKEIISSLTTEQRKEYAIALKKYRNSAEWKNIVKDGEQLVNDLAEDIRNAQQDGYGKNAEQRLIYSDMDMKYEHARFMEMFVKKIKAKDEGAQFFKNWINDGAKAVDSHIINGFGAGKDAPMFSEADHVRYLRSLNKSVLIELEALIAQCDPPLGEVSEDDVYKAHDQISSDVLQGSTAEDDEFNSYSDHTLEIED